MACATAIDTSGGPGLAKGRATTALPDLASHYLDIADAVQREMDGLGWGATVRRSWSRATGHVTLTIDVPDTQEHAEVVRHHHQAVAKLVKAAGFSIGKATVLGRLVLVSWGAPVTHEEAVDAMPTDHAPPESTASHVFATGENVDSDPDPCPSTVRSVDVVAALMVDAAPTGPAPVRYIEPLPAQDRVRVVLCSACQAGRRHRRYGCNRCGELGIRVFVGACEMKSPPRAPADRVAVVEALAAILPSLHAEPRHGAHLLMDLALRGADAVTREAALTVWRGATAAMAAE